MQEKNTLKTAFGFLLWEIGLITKQKCLCHELTVWQDRIIVNDVREKKQILLTNNISQ